MTTKAELLALVEQYASKVGVHSAIEATRIATARKDRGANSVELRIKGEAQDLKVTIRSAIDTLPID